MNQQNPNNILAIIIASYRCNSIVNSVEGNCGCEMLDYSVEVDKMQS